MQWQSCLQIDLVVIVRVIIPVLNVKLSVHRNALSDDPYFQIMLDSFFGFMIESVDFRVFEVNQVNS